MENNKRVLEALQMQPLSEEEKTARHILGRLYGPIATCKESTRNGRLYNKTLWENALQDNVFKEKIATKALFLELGHPADREETDMSKACACIPEIPKIVDDDLYAYVDILDTPNGKILKTLCDYGFIPGISSRGSGDLMANNEVDPETFFLETWDIVQLPAVKKARLAVCESFDTKSLRLKKALTESLNSATDEDKKVMEETLENLDIKLEEEDTLPGGTPKNIDDIPEATETPDEAKVLTEDADEEEVEEVAVEEEEETTDETTDDEPATEDEIAKVEEVAEGEADEDLGLTVGKLTDSLKDFDKDTDVEITVEGNDDNTITVVIGATDEDDNSFSFGTVFSLDEVMTGVANKADEPETTEEVESEVTETEEAGDAGDDAEVMESLKEMVRQKDALEKEVKTLKDDKAVSDAKVEELTESLKKYQTAFERTSALASKASGLRKEVAKLNEQLSTKDVKIKELSTEVSKAQTLTESVNTEASKVQKLTESLTAAKDEAKVLQESLDKSNKLVKDRTAIAKKYQSRFFEAVNRYIESKAAMLGVQTTDIKSKLTENFTMDDIDKVCNDLLDSTVNLSRLPFGTNRVRVNESKAPVTKAKADPDAGYEIDESLLVLAGLK